MNIYLLAFYKEICWKMLCCVVCGTGNIHIDIDIGAYIFMCILYTYKFECIYNLEIGDV